jgi:anti-anti-sigma regulatory factor
MFETGLDKTKNLLRIAYSGRIEADEVKQCLEQLQSLTIDLKPGFRLLTDLTALEAMDTASVPYIRKMMDLCNKGGVAMVVRVIPDPHKDIGLNILSLFHYRHDLHIVTCGTLEEAIKVLGN